MARGARACPVCPVCGSKKFRIVNRRDGEDEVTLECISCKKRITV